MATIKQKRVFQKALKGTPIHTAMVEEGYSEKSNVATLTRTQGWKELLEQHIPDEMLAIKHRELLQKTDKNGEIDVNAVTKALDMAYKLKGRFEVEPEKPNSKTVVAVQVIINGNNPEGRTDTETIISA